MREAREQAARLGDRAVEVKYEDFLAGPSETLRPLAGFCGLGAAEADIDRAASEVNKSRGYAFLKDPELKTYSLEIVARLGDYGY